MNRFNDKNGLNIVYKEELDSTNNYLDSLCRDGVVEEYSTVVSDFQSRGKGQRGNTWESERGANLTFSTLVYPGYIEARKQFIISMLVSTVICDVLLRYTDGIKIKWPNDIYWNDKKICGMLIENDLQGMAVARSIIGIGLNVNQRHFISDAPNPVSLYQILSKECDRERILLGIVGEIRSGFDKLKAGDEGFVHYIYSKYKAYLYRGDGTYTFRDENGEFAASIDNVELDGHLVLLDSDMDRRRYIFKQVQFVI